jgi:hypothetical protein
MAYTRFTPLTWQNGVANPALGATNLNARDGMLAFASAAGPSHVVYQQGGQTIARRADGSVVSSLSTSSANNPVVIQAALDAANSGNTPAANTHVPGGHVMIAAADYTMATGVTIPYSVAMSGPYGSWYDAWNSAGTFGAQLRATSAVGSSALVQMGVDSEGTRVATNPHGAWLGQLVVDSTASTGPSVQIMDSAFVVLENLYIKPGSGQTGIDITGSLGVFDGTFDSNIFRVTVKGGGRGMHVHLVPGGDFTGTDGMLHKCRFKSQTIAAIETDYGGWQIMQNHFTHGGGAYHVLSTVGGPDVLQIVGNYFDSGTIEHLNIKSAHIVIVSNNLFLADGLAHTPTGTSDALCQFPWGKVHFTDNILRLTNGGSGVKGFVYTGDTARGRITGNSVYKGTGWADWVAPVVTSSGTAQADVTTPASRIGDNIVWN